MKWPWTKISEPGLVISTGIDFCSQASATYEVRVARAAWPAVWPSIWENARKYFDQVGRPWGPITWEGLSDRPLYDWNGDSAMGAGSPDHFVLRGRGDFIITVEKP